MKIQKLRRIGGIICYIALGIALFLIPIYHTEIFYKRMGLTTFVIAWVAYFFGFVLFIDIPVAAKEEKETTTQ